MSKAEGLPPFHLAMPVGDLDATRAFYRDLLGCTEGRTSDRWIDFDLYGHQFVIHLVESYQGGPAGHSPVQDHDVPVPHFGVILPMDDWNALARRLQGKVQFVVEPHTRYVGKPGEHSSMFFLDPSGNALEFKAFRNPDVGLFDPEY